MVDGAVRGLSRRDHHNQPYFTVARGEHEHVQTYRTGDGTYAVEYRDGGPDAHFKYRTPDIGLVADVMWGG